MTDETIHVLLVEDNPGDIRLIRSLLAETPSVHFTWEHVEQLGVATEILRKEPFDLVLLDLSLPDSQGLDTFSRLYPHAICLPIVVLTNINDEPLALKAVQARAQDYFVKGQVDDDPLVNALRHAIERKHIETALRVKIRELTAMIQRVIEEAVLIPRTLGPHLLNDYLEQIKEDRVPSYGQLSPREREVVRLIARGRTNKEIAKRLSISERTVERHRSSIMNKLGLQNHAELVAYAVQQGIMSEGD